MTLIRDGIPASPGIVIGPAYVLRWEPLRVPHVTVTPDQIDGEIARFHEAREWARERLRSIQAQTAEKLGSVEAQIFEPQILMLDDPDLVEGTVSYIRDNLLGAARAFELRMLEYQSDWSRSGHPMVMDRMNDLLDVQIRVMRRLLGVKDIELSFDRFEQPVVLLARDLTPSITVQLDREWILGIGTDAGTRTSHSAILARSLQIPAVVSLGDLSQLVQNGQQVILDGREGRVLVAPELDEVERYRERDFRIREWEQELVLLAHLQAVTPDNQHVVLRGNIDLPSEAAVVRAHGARGIGLYRTEFFVVGRSTPPEEEEQYRCYRDVTEVFPDDAVFIRTFDLGGDKFPAFLHMPPEENPFLGWRAIRVLLDMPELFRVQLRALLRSTAHGDVRIMLPLVNEIDEIQRTRELLDEEAEKLRSEGIRFNPGYKLGAMIETPAAALTSHELARYCDFFSIGTNDLVQYTLAVDRSSSELAYLASFFEPAVLRMIASVVRAGADFGRPVALCGAMASDPLAAMLLVGLGLRELSMEASAIPAVREAIGTITLEEAEDAARAALEGITASDVERMLMDRFGERLALE